MTRLLLALPLLLMACQVPCCPEPAPEPEPWPYDWPPEVVPGRHEASDCWWFEGYWLCDQAAHPWPEETP